jgi:hypothetical protein
LKIKELERERERERQRERERDQETERFLKFSGRNVNQRTKCFLF